MDLEKANIHQLIKHAKRHPFGMMAAEEIVKKRISVAACRCCLPKKKQRELKMLPAVGNGQ
jgi:hypothetical protein